MKHLFLLLFMMLCCTTMNAQKDVTTFLGIPVDGTKTEMRQKLMTKGFTPKMIDEEEYLEGEFNGTDVFIKILTNNNKVFRIAVRDARMCDETDIKIRFNKLVNQFENNQRYFHFDQYTISDTEDISSEMRLYNKTFEALFYQERDTTKHDSVYSYSKMREQMLKKYSPEQLENPTEKITKEAISISSKIYAENLLKKKVWFRIFKKKYQDEYFIAIFYDNEYNRANGEDL